MNLFFNSLPRKLFQMLLIPLTLKVNKNHIYSKYITDTNTFIPSSGGILDSLFNSFGSIYYIANDVTDLTAPQPITTNSIQLYNNVGQRVYQKDVITQVNFIDDRFILPGKIAPGVYTIQIANPEFSILKKILIQ